MVIQITFRDRQQRRVRWFREGLRDLNVCRRNGGAKLHSPIAGEYHPHADTSRHTRVHSGDCHANTGALDGNVHPGIDTRADEVCVWPEQATRIMMVGTSAQSGSLVIPVLSSF